MKYIKIFEDFDLDKFMENPEEFFHDDSRKDLVEGDYIKCYRGFGQVLNIGPIFAEVQLLDGQMNIVKVPIDNLVKITKEEAIEKKKNTYDSSKDLKSILDQISEYVDVLSTGDYLEDLKVKNPESAAEYLEEVLVEILSLSRKDPYISHYLDFSKLVNAVASVAHYAMDETEDESIKKRITSVLEKFYELASE
jgi:hypothetical protein